MTRRALLILPLLALPTGAHAAGGNCTTIDVDFMPAAQASNPFAPQIVAWLEQPDGTFIETIFITQQTGLSGIGNRPGRFDFNSGPNWPYGRRTTVFPIWAHRHGLSWDTIGFKNSHDEDLSHPSDDSSLETHFCRPLRSSGKDQPQWDAMTCASSVFTDKGKMDASARSLYPPRNDISKQAKDDAVVDTYATLNPFDAVSGATPPSGTPATFSYIVPEELPFGDYVMMVEVSREFDMNGSYNPTVFPSPNVAYSEYGQPYRGQPSVVYRMAFRIEDGETTASTKDYVGYGDPDGNDGALRSPDGTITMDVPGSGAARLQLLSTAGASYRLRLVSRPQDDSIAPTAPGETQIAAVSSNRATIAFLAPGDDGVTGKAKRYELRYVVGPELGDATFASATLAATALPSPGGSVQAIELGNLLPETEYTVGIRAIDDCRNVGPISYVTFTTTERESGEIDACFIATAAYGSVMARDVEPLRRFRDTMLRGSVFGELAVATYYTFSPPVAGVVGESDLLRATARDLLDPIVRRVRSMTVQ
ncbi:MAG: CFI-box-CTERM domain-containing protein [Kofleriaceae bacterium]